MDDFFRSLHVSTPELTRLLQSSPDGALLTVPNGYYLFFIFDASEDATNGYENGEVLVHCGIYQDITQALIGLNNQYQRVDDEYARMLFSINMSLPTGNNSYLYTVLQNTIDQDIKNNSKPLSIHYFSLPTGNYPLETVVDILPVVPVSTYTTSPMTNIYLRKYIQSLTVSTPEIKRKLLHVSNRNSIRIPPGYHLYFIYDKNTNQLLYTNIHDTGVNAIIGMLNQYDIANSDYAMSLVAPLLETQPNDAKTTTDQFFSFLTSTIEHNYSQGKAPFVLKWFSLPTGDYNATTEITNIIPSKRLFNLLRVR